MHRFGLNLKRYGWIGGKRQDDPERNVGYGERSGRSKREHDGENARDDGVDIEVFGYAGAHAADQRVARTVQSLLGCHGFSFPRLAARRSIAASTSESEASPYSIRSLAVSVDSALPPR